MHTATLQQQHSIIDMYRQGLSVTALSKSFGLQYAAVRQILVAFNVAIRPKSKTAAKGSDHPQSKLTGEQRQQLIEELQRGEVQHGELARHYGITRERVRQLAQMHGAPVGRVVQRIACKERARLRREQAVKRSLAIKEARLRCYDVWRELWKSGHSIKEMAEKLRISAGAVGVRITGLRKKHPDWFPYRRPAGAG